MLFELSQEQQDLADAVAGMLELHCSPETVRAAWERPDEVVDQLWKHLGALDLGAIVVEPRLGGGGGDAVDLAVVLEVAGRHALPAPLLETAGVFAGLVNRHPGHPLVQGWLPGLLDGTLRAGVQLAPGELVAHAQAVTVLVALRGDEVHLVPVDTPRVEARTGIDHSRALGAVRVATGPDTLLTAEPGAAGRVRRGYDLGRAAVLVGLCDRLVAIAADYARQREQFGRPIGSFQGIKHPLASAAASVEATRSVLWRAALAESGDETETDQLVAVLTGLAATMASRVAPLALQVHGGIGFTWESDVHLWVKRVLALQPSARAVRASRELVARGLLAEGPGPSIQ